MPSQTSSCALGRQPLADPLFLTQLALLESLGEGDFFEKLLGWMHEVLQTDQCMLFFLGNDQPLSTLLYKDFSADARARQLAFEYISEGRYRHDPNFARLVGSEEGRIETWCLDDLGPSMPREYRKRFFEAPGFVDKWSILFRARNGCFYLNLYSRRQIFRDLFGTSLPDENTVARLLAVLIGKHYQISQVQLSQGPLAFLSERERQVCEGTLAGKKAEAIAHELGVAASSIVTYRKRAYDKLGINSRAQLFALCHGKGD
ncbi:helix-turn-helix transcriptional regulator [Parathalassolituus penaei]|uniref:Helix-turn-helix transcriptional regulator n=1 Tax=Parathalassolituus penaei TaxID=2997323 RepID=A0A9X3IR83_9GAMM|nr:helix-turn-helix transcriptional regulator [Parathalassolituus penaei]MCY0964596.1 helix-turn-helix transcriptional regulator [Parathalassolituus penaei]